MQPATDVDLGPVLDQESGLFLTHLGQCIDASQRWGMVRVVMIGQNSPRVHSTPGLGSPLEPCNGPFDYQSLFFKCIDPSVSLQVCFHFDSHIALLF